MATFARRRAAALVPLALALACSGPPSRTEENKQLVRRYIADVFNSGRVDLLPHYVSPDYVEVLDNAVYPIGIEGARDHALGVRAAFPDLHITVEQQVAEGEWVVSRITARGTHLGPWLGMKPTGRPLAFCGVNINRVVDGRIVEHGGAANLLGPLLEAGAVQLAGEPGGA